MQDGAEGSISQSENIGDDVFPETGQTLVYAPAFFFLHVSVCLWAHTARGRTAGELLSVCSLPSSRPVFISQIFPVLHQPWPAAARQAVSLTC